MDGVMEQSAARIVRGEPTAAEIAALMAVLMSRPVPVPAAAKGVSAWWRSGLPGQPTTLRPGPGAWQQSALPR
jgi:hypothetical protein